MLPDRVKLGLAWLVHRLELAPPLDVVEIEVPVAGLPPALRGYTIAHVSDLHVGHGDWEPARLHEVAGALRAASPDVVVNTGDFLQGSPPVERVVRRVKSLYDAHSRVPHLAVLGNHDYYAGEAAVAELMAGLVEIGIRVLTNQTVNEGPPGAEIAFVGLTEEAVGFYEAVEQLAQTPRPRIILTHHAEMVEQLPPQAADLVLSGHTHGGQVALGPLTPLIVRVFNGSRYIDGRYLVNGTRVYINRGLGYTGVPFRWGAAPELTLFRLVPA